MDGLESIIESMTGVQWRIRVVGAGAELTAPPVFVPFPADAFPDEIEIEEQYNANIPLGMPEYSEVKVKINAAGLSDEQFALLTSYEEFGTAPSAFVFVTVSGRFTSGDGAVVVSETIFTDTQGVQYTDATVLRIPTAILPMSVFSTPAIIVNGGEFGGYGPAVELAVELPAAPPVARYYPVWYFQRLVGTTWQTVFIGTQRATPVQMIEFDSTGDTQTLEVTIVEIVRTASESVPLSVCLEDFVAGDTGKYRPIYYLDLAINSRVAQVMKDMTRGLIQFFLRNNPESVQVDGETPFDTAIVVETDIKAVNLLSDPESSLYLGEKFPTAYDYIQAMYEAYCVFTTVQYSPFIAGPTIWQRCHPVGEYAGTPSFVTPASSDTLSLMKYSAGSDLRSFVAEYPMIERNETVKYAEPQAVSGQDYAIYIPYHNKQAAGTTVPASDQPAIIHRGDGALIPPPVRIYYDVSSYVEATTTLPLAVVQFLLEWFNTPQSGLFEFENDSTFPHLGQGVRAFRSRFGSTRLGHCVYSKLFLKSGKGQFKVRLR